MQSYDNLFLALRPDKEIAEVVERRVVPEVRRIGGFSERSRGVDLFHLTLLRLGGYETVPKALVAGVRDAFRDFSHTGFEIELNRARRFAKGAVVLTGDDVDAVCGLSSELRRRLRAKGVRGVGPVCSTPHMTLLYSPRPFHEHKTQPVKWRVREFCLIHSLVGQSRHVVIEQWPLLVNETVGA